VDLWANCRKSNSRDEPFSYPATQLATSGADFSSLEPLAQIVPRIIAKIIIYVNISAALYGPERPYKICDFSVESLGIFTARNLFEIWDYLCRTELSRGFPVEIAPYFDVDSSTERHAVTWILTYFRIIALSIPAHSLAISVPFTSK